MGRPGKRTSAEEEAQRHAVYGALSSVAPTTSNEASSAALNTFHAAAAVEALLKNSQASVSSSYGSARPSDQNQLFLGGGGFEHLQSLARNPALLQRVAKSVLPRSAPVSSLLPPLPPEGLSSQGLLALQTHLASIVAGPGSLLGGNSTASNSLQGASDISSVQQLLAAQATSKPGMAHALTPNMHTWSLDKLGMFRC